GELFEQRARELAQVAPRERRVPPVRQPQTGPVAARAGLALDEPGLGERAEQPRDGARVRAERAGELVHAARPAAVGEQVEQRDRPLDRGDRAALLPHAADHTSPSPAIARNASALVAATFSESTPGRIA